MLSNNIRSATKSIKSVKWRSSLTVLAIVIGIVCLTTILSLGKGVSKQLDSQYKRAGKDLISIRPGQPIIRDSQGDITQVNISYGYGFGSASLLDSDLNVVKSTKGVSLSSPINLVTGSAVADDREYLDGLVVGSSPDLPQLINQDIEFGSFITSDETESNIAVIGKTVAEELFNDSVPIGRSLTIRGQEFIVKGVFEQFQPNTLVLGADFNKAIFIPYETSRAVAKQNSQIVQILAKAQNSNETSSVVSLINKDLAKIHNFQSDFAVLTQPESIRFNKKVLSSLINYIGAIALIALLAAGVGIMNIMLLSVTERTRELGIRKALGATNHQLLMQFWLEAIILSLIGVIFGIIGTFLMDYFLRIFTDLKPVVGLLDLLIASTVTMALGVIFGVIPAYKASRKDPIDALRHEA